nr:hypothetical protein BgiMline_034842 [Biomphalaria glabrata]
MFNCCSHGTLLHFSLQSSRFEYLLLPPRSAPGAAPPRIASQASTLTPAALLLVSACLPDSIAETARYRSDALAPSIFRAG